jgi:hypothetical protein
LHEFPNPGKGVAHVFGPGARVAVAMFGACAMAVLPGAGATATLTAAPAGRHVAAPIVSRRGPVMPIRFARRLALLFGLILAAAPAVAQNSVVIVPGL